VAKASADKDVRSRTVFFIVVSFMPVLPARHRSNP
jgi:hypothetical protein